MVAPVPARIDASSQPWWREPSFWLMLAVVLAVFCSRPAALSIRGEESRWARVAVEMLESGDFLVPRQQGVVFPDRPPLGSWLIALSMHALGSHGPLAVRLPNILATIATTMLVYGYARTWQSAWGASVSGLAFATCAQVLQLGGLAESEAVYTCCLGGAMLVWSWGYERNWHPAAYWLGGYALLTLATLSKGVQAPLYFLGGTGTFLLLRKDFKGMFSLWNFLGLALAASIVAAWLLQLASATSFQDAESVLLRHATSPLFHEPWTAFVKHAAPFPVVFWGAMLPWSLLLLAYFHRDVRREIALRGGQALFIFVCSSLAMMTCMLKLGARPRYLMPLIPGLAALMGGCADLAIARLRCASAESWWRWYSRGLAVAMPLTVLGLMIVRWLTRPNVSVSAEGLWLVGAWAVVTMLCAVVAWQSARLPPRLPSWSAALAVAVFALAGYPGVITQWLVEDSPRSAPEIAKLRESIPPERRLVSLEPIGHLFAYHFDATIPILPWPREDRELPGDVEFFCFDHSRHAPPKSLPFAWDKIAEVSCERSYQSPDGRVVIVGRRLEHLSAVPHRKR